MALPLLAGCDLDLSGLGSCDEEESWTESISASGITSLRVLAEAGHLRVEGRSGTNSIRVRATACANSRTTLDDTYFDLFVRGSIAELETDVPRRDNARLDLVVEVPVRLAAVIYHAEGDLEVSNVEVVFIDDEEGNIDVDNIVFDVDIEDGSGHINIARVGGDVTIDDGSGNIDVEDVDGDLIVYYNSSGSITHRNVRGRVQLP